MGSFSRAWLACHSAEANVTPYVGRDFSLRLGHWFKAVILAYILLCDTPVTIGGQIIIASGFQHALQKAPVLRGYVSACDRFDFVDDAF